jgi:hypothetical protein
MESRVTNKCHPPYEGRSAGFSLFRRVGPGKPLASIITTLLAANVVKATPAKIAEMFAIGYRVSPLSKSVSTDCSGTLWRKFRSRTIVVWVSVAGVH